MDITTGREFKFTNPQDDPNLYPEPPKGYEYSIYGKLYKVKTPSIETFLNIKSNSCNVYVLVIFLVLFMLYNLNYR